MREPNLDRHFALIGQIAFYWNRVESAMDALIGSFIPPRTMDDAFAVNLIISRLGNIDRLKVLRELTRRFPFGAKGNDRFNHAIKAFEALHENRNLLVHSGYAYTSKMGQLIWAKPSKSKPGMATHSLAPLRVLQSQVTSLTRLERYLCDLAETVFTARLINAVPQSWPKKFHPPRKLTQPDLGTFQTDRRLP